jgi:glycosyltransferase involved in cell wall biosynthesis
MSAQSAARGWPRISVVTPAYNSAELLEDCIVSVLEQGYPNLEYIVIDGASTDGSLEILRRYEDRLTYWTSEPDDGQADALNKGFRRATGELVCWLNSDDFFYPGALAAAAEAYLADPDAPFYFGNGYRVDRAGRKVAEFFPDGHVHFRRDAFVFGLNCVLQPSTFIRRSALEQVGLLNDSLHYGFDSNLWIELSALGRPRPIRKHLAASREYDGTKTSTGSFGRAEELRRIAERHADVAATPGSISYYLDTLHRLASSRPDVFPREYLAAIEAFWSATAQLFARYGARPDGFPVPNAADLVKMEPLPEPKTDRMRIGIELRQVTRGASGGIVVVLVGTLQELFKRRLDIDFVVFCTVFNRELLATDAPNVEMITLPLGGFFAELGRIAREREIDVLIRSYPTVEEVDFPLKRQVFLLPDVQHEYHPEFFDAKSLNLRRRAFRTPLLGAGAIMTISEHARQTIEQQAVAERDVFVASPSLPPEFVAARSKDATDEERALLPDADFFFFPANLWPHKNHERLFEALRRFRERTGKPVELVLTGAPAGWEELRARHGDLPIRHLGYVSYAVVRLLYERAIALTFFSQYEGFGIPLLEAFEVGTPVLCSNTTSLPEVAGDAALMCDPTDVDAMSELLERIAGDADLRTQLVACGKQRLGANTWRKAADRLASGIERVLERTKLPSLGELPLVSIVTPSYNQGRFIRRTIESVLAQTYPNIEYLVVDGASTDETLGILRRHGDRVRWISEPDSGQTEAINKGLRAVSGEIVGYLNSDDVLLPDAIETIVEYFRSHPECDLVYGDAEYIDEEDRVIGTYATADYSFERLMKDCCICQPAAYWRSVIGEVVGPFDEELHYAMDYDHWIRVDRSGFMIQHMQETIAQSRLHPAMKTLCARRAIYREIFHVCRRGGGYISRDYVDGLWSYFAYERRYSPVRLLRAAPQLRRMLVSVHYRWLNRHLYTRRQWLTGSVRAAKRLIVRRLQRTPRLFSILLVHVKAWLRSLRARLGVLRGLMPRVARAANGEARVRGYWSDNWIEERLEVVLDARERDRELRIVGRPITGMTVEVSAHGARLGRFELAGDRQETVTVQLPPGPAETVSFSFSHSTVDTAGRPISFLLQETNLFREEDLAALV